MNGFAVDPVGTKSPLMIPILFYGFHNCDEGAIKIYEYLNKRFDLGLNISDISIYENSMDKNDVKGQNAVILITQTTNKTNIYYDSSFIFAIYKRNKKMSFIKSRFCPGIV